MRFLSQRHHYVPETLIKPWCVSEKNVVWGYYWDTYQNQIRRTEKGPRGFCYRFNLFSTSEGNSVSDNIESEFLSFVDSYGAIVRDRLIVDDPSSLSLKDKVHFIRLLLSLEWRRPDLVRKLRNEGENFRNILDTYNEAINLLKKLDIQGTPSDFVLDTFGISFEDRGLIMIKKLLNNEKITDVLLNSFWSVIRFGRDMPRLVLSDRPLIRIGNSFLNNYFWALPLSPRVLFYITPNMNSDNIIKNYRKKELIRDINYYSVHQCDKYVFSIDNYIGLDRSWLKTRFIAKSNS